MGDSRARILANIRRALPSVRRSLADTSETHPHQPVQPPLPGDVVAAFCEAARSSAAEVSTLTALKDLPEWVRQEGQVRPDASRIVLSPELQKLAATLPEGTGDRTAGEEGGWGLVGAFAGIAETGTAVCLSADAPSETLFLVERLTVLLNITDILAYQEDVWKKLRQRFPEKMPGAVHLITGPSRTADVEQTIQLGAHGPRWVDYLIIG